MSRVASPAWAPGFGSRPGGTMSVSLDNLEPIDVRPSKRALISVYDKTGLEELARALGEAGVESPQVRHARIAAAGVAPVPVRRCDRFPEVLEVASRPCPFIHSGILADQRKAAHVASRSRSWVSRRSTWLCATCILSQIRLRRVLLSMSASSRLTSVARPWCARPRRITRRSRS